MSTRREFITLVGGAAAGWPLAASGQLSTHIPLVVVWIGGDGNDPEVQARTEAFRNSLRALGWIDGRNVKIETHWPTFFSAEAMRATASEIAALNPDVIVTTGAPVLAAMYRQTKTIPIVFTLITDPVSDGFVASLAQPGGNVTGFTLFEHSFAGKWLEMLKEAVPNMTRVAVIQNADHPAWNAYLRAINGIAPGMGVKVTPLPINSPAEVDLLLKDFGREPNGGLIILPSSIGTMHREVVAKSALRHHLPSIYALKMYPASGGFMSYGVVVAEPYRQAATYVDRILRGTKTGELPVQAASKFQMVINLKTAKALGLEVPPTLLARADEVIE